MSLNIPLQQQRIAIPLPWQMQLGNGGLFFGTFLSANKRKYVREKYITHSSKFVTRMLWHGVINADKHLLFRTAHNAVIPLTLPIMVQTINNTNCQTLKTQQQESYVTRPSPCRVRSGGWGPPLTNVYYTC